jgi:uncharacterized membrane-anchored protein
MSNSRTKGGSKSIHARSALTKVPEITAMFWLVKLLTTGMGETASDFMNHKFGPGVAVPFMLVGLAIALKLQFKISRYDARYYWFVVAMVGVFGTSAADALHIGFGVPYAVSTLFCVIATTVVFGAWFASEGTLSIHSIYTRRREQFYWATVLATFALGTAAGDLTAMPLNLGYFWSGVMFAGLIAIPAVGYWKFGMNPIFAFWFAYILTRPLGASFADWVAVPAARGGLGVGAGTVTLAMIAIIVACVSYLWISRADVMEDEGTEPLDPAIHRAESELTGLEPEFGFQRD